MILEKEKLISLLYPVEMFTFEDVKVLINAECIQITDSNGRFSFFRMAHFRDLYSEIVRPPPPSDLGFPYDTIHVYRRPINIKGYGLFRIRSLPPSQSCVARVKLQTFFRPYLFKEMFSNSL